MSKKNENTEAGTDIAGLVPPELKSGMTQKQNNLANKEGAKNALRAEGHDVPRTEDALAHLSVKERNMMGKEDAKQALRAEGHQVPETEAGKHKRTQRERNLANKAAAKDAIKKDAKARK